MIVVGRYEAYPWIEEWRDWLAERGLDANNVREVELFGEGGATAVVHLRNDEGRAYLNESGTIAVERVALRSSEGVPPFRRRR